MAMVAPMMSGRWVAISGPVSSTSCRPVPVTQPALDQLHELGVVGSATEQQHDVLAVVEADLAGEVLLHLLPPGVLLGAGAVAPRRFWRTVVLRIGFSAVRRTGRARDRRRPRYGGGGSQVGSGGTSRARSCPTCSPMSAVE